MKLKTGYFDFDLSSHSASSRQAIMKPWYNNVRNYISHCGSRVGNKDVVNIMDIISPVHPKGNQSWIFIGRTDAEAETPIFGHLMWRTDSLGKTLMLGKIKGRGEGDDRGWDGWMASLTWWTWVWASFGSWWWTGKPGVLQSMGSQRVRHDWATELNWTSSYTRQS